IEMNIVPLLRHGHFAHVSDGRHPLSISRMTFQQGLHVRTPSRRDWLNLSYYATSSRDEDSLATMFCGIKQPEKFRAASVALISVMKL
ncbi:MAG TPA: hypothetical protein VNT80_02220, partial [Acidimicrobiales bacterium]|nr:hypothetical protein [Acidimicrobiales bacterium]